MLLRRIRPPASTLLLALVVTIVATIAACAPKQQPEPAWEQDAVFLLSQADAQLAVKQYEQSSKTIEAFFERFPSSRHRDRAYYLLGEIHFAKRDYALALRSFKEILEQYPASPLTIQARYKLGRCYYELGNYDLAVANLEDRSKITDPVQLRHSAEMLSTAYLAQRNYLAAVKEFAYLAKTTESERRAGYRDTIRRIIENNLSEDELYTLSDGRDYPSDLAGLRLTGLLVEQREYRAAIRAAKDFIDKFSGHPEKTRAEMLINEAMLGLSSPRYHLAALLPQTGQLAFFGDRVLKGIQLAVHTYNLQNPDNRVDVIVRNTEGSPEMAAAALTELTDQGIVAAIGPLLTKEVEAIAPELDTLHVPVITPAASGEGLGTLSPWLFRNALTNESQAAGAARYALIRNLQKIAILYPDDAYGRDLARLFANDLEREADILASISYPPNVRDFGAIAKRLMEIDLRSRKIPIPNDPGERKKLFQDYTPGFDGLYLPGYADEVGLLLPQLAFYNISGIAVIGSNNWHSEALIERAGRHAEGAVFMDGFFPESSDPAIKTVIDNYYSAYQEQPDILSAQAYDAAMMVLSLLKEGNDTPEEIRDALLALTGYPGISGDTTFAGSGEARKKLFLIEVQSGRFIQIGGAQSLITSPSASNDGSVKDQ